MLNNNFRKNSFPVNISSTFSDPDEISLKNDLPSSSQRKDPSMLLEFDTNTILSFYECIETFNLEK